MFPTISDLAAAADEHGLDKLVVVEPSPDFPGELLFQADDFRAFFTEYKAWLSRHCILNDAFMLEAFVDQLRTDGREPVFLPSCEPLLAAHARWRGPLDVVGFTCPGDGALFGYQTFGLRRALERAGAPDVAGRLFFVNWAAGAGKTLFACAGAQELVNRGLVDRVLVLTTSPLKVNMLRAFEATTKLDATMVEGTPAKRRDKYAEGQQVLILNYDRLRVDYEHVSRLTEGQRVLIVADECQKVLTDAGQTQARKKLDDLIAGCEATIWPMSASVVRASPARYRDVFALDGHPRSNPLGTRADFDRRYVLGRQTFRTPTKYGGVFTWEKITWDIPRLAEIRHRVADRAHAVRKTDPSVRSQFKGMTSMITPIQLSPEDARLYDAVIERADQARENEEGGLPGYALLLRHVCNNPLALLRSEVPFGRELAQKYPKLVTGAHSAKLAVLVDQLEAVRGAGDKCVLFTSWVHTSLELISDELHKHKISHVVHHGQQSDALNQAAQDKFKGDDSVTVFLSSDAGAFGLNLPEARTVISYEPTFSWDVLMQRSERINRADSQLEGLSAVTYVTDDTIEGRIAKVCEERRLLAANTLGTTETLNTGTPEPSMRWLIFG